MQHAVQTLGQFLARRDFKGNSRLADFLFRPREPLRDRCFRREECPCDFCGAETAKGLQRQVFLGAVFPILLNTYTGIKSVRENLINVVKAFGGSPLQVFFKVMIPDATPAIITGLRLAVGRAVISVVVAELFGAEAGLGFMVYFYSQRFLPGPVFVGIVVLVVFGILSFLALEKIQGWLSPWYTYQLQRQAHRMEAE